MEDSPSLAHLPLLFWVTEAIRPNIVATIGIEDAVPHFGICQVVDKLGLDSVCYGISEVAEADRSDLTSVAKFNEDNFCDFSYIMHNHEYNPDEFLHGGKIDLLVVNQDASEALYNHLEDNWLPNLSNRGVIIFLRGGNTPEYDTYIHRLSQDKKLFIFNAKTRACLLLQGLDQPEPLQRLADLSIGKPGYLTARNVFSRLGELHTKSQLLKKRQRETELLKTELSELKSVFESTETERKKVEQLTSKQEEELSERFSDIATLGLELKKKDEEIENLNTECNKLQQLVSSQKAEIEALKCHLAGTEEARSVYAERVTALEGSTSWRMTSPLRKLSLHLKRH